MCIPTQLLIEFIHFIVSKDRVEIIHKLVSKLANSTNAMDTTTSFGQIVKDYFELLERMAGSRSSIELRIFAVERLLRCALLEPLMKGLLKEPGEGLLGRGS
jgi:hypothetical protein